MIKEFFFPKDNPKDVMDSFGLKQTEQYDIWSYPPTKTTIYDWEKLSSNIQKSIRNRFIQLGYGEKDRLE